MAIMFEIFPRHERGFAMGLFMTGWSLGPFLGPLLGGYLAEHVHWRAIFYINIPTGVLSIFAGYFILPRTSSTTAAPPLDGFGLLTLTGASTRSAPLSMGQSMAGEAISPSGSLPLTHFLCVFYRKGAEIARSSFWKYAAFETWTLVWRNILIFFRVLGFRGSSFLVSLFLQKGLNYSPTQAGIFLLPGALITGLWSPVAGIVIDGSASSADCQRVPHLRFRPLRPFHIDTWSSAACIFLFMWQSVGQSSLNAPLNTVALAALPEGRARMGSGMIGMTRGLGDAFSIGIVSFCTSDSLISISIPFLSFRELCLAQSSGRCLVPDPRVSFIRTSLAAR